MVKYFNTRTNRMAVLQSTENSMHVLKFEDNNEEATITDDVLKRWYVEVSPDYIDLEVGTKEIRVTRDNMNEMIETYPEIADIIKNKFNTIEADAITDNPNDNSNENSSVDVQVPIANGNFIKISSVLKKDGIAKFVEVYKVNDIEFEVTEYAEGQWIGWISGVKVDGKRFKNLKKAFESVQLSAEELKAFVKFRKTVRPQIEEPQAV